VLAPDPAICAEYTDQFNQYQVWRAAMIARLDFASHKEER
jgi:hypothetical protein